ncbi:MAG: hypothetical protein GKS06_06475 [Acidobacteria bacterium]|nr:hypothetical protein [Acidobacteriota bacterium]
MKLRHLVTVLGLLAAIVVTTATPAPAAQEPYPELPVTLVMNAQSIGNSISGQTRMVVRITRWSPPAERDQVLGALRELGPGAVRKELQGLEEAGRIRIGTENSYPIQYAGLSVLENGDYRLVLATDRDIDIWESYYRTRTLDYDVALAELRITRDDLRGEGVLAAGVTLGWDADASTVVIENYDQQPMRLRNIRVEQ